jgi:hypothetical protein
MGFELKEKHLREIKTLEAEYSYNISQIENIHERQKDISSRMQLILNKLKK